MYMPIELQKVIQDYARPVWTRRDWRTCRAELAHGFQELVDCLKKIPLDTFYECIRITIMPFERKYNKLLDIFPIRRLRSIR
uniref:Uncharacterized protein n=1 Tax=viral metagenome TaxID=1070528 RepID=A0A6C0AI87_9ZZZZ